MLWGLILTLGLTLAHPTIRALNKSQKSDIFFATFDLSDEIVATIKAGQIRFAVDQQPYLQGYLPITLLALYSRYQLIPSNHINPGPVLLLKTILIWSKNWLEKFADSLAYFYWQLENSGQDGIIPPCLYLVGILGLVEQL